MVTEFYDAILTLCIDGRLFASSFDMCSRWSHKLRQLAIRHTIQISRLHRYVIKALFTL